MTSITTPTPAPRDRPAALTTRVGWIVVSGLLIGAALAVDEPVGRWLALHDQPRWIMFARCMSQVGQWWMLATAGGLCGAYCFVIGKPERMRAAFLVTLAGLSTGLCATVLRFLIGRTRPDANVPQGFYGPWHDSHWIFGQAQFGSFPSGHTATAVAFAAALWQLNRRAGLLAGLFAGIIAWSRIALSRHHFSDIVAAALLGAAGARLAMARLGPLLDRAAGPSKKP